YTSCIMANETNTRTSPTPTPSPVKAVGLLRPILPESIRLTLSAKQNYALVAEEIFCHSLDRTIWSFRTMYSDVERHLLCIKNVAMESLASDAGIDNVCEMVFSDQTLREFIFSLQTQF